LILLKEETQSQQAKSTIGNNRASRNTSEEAKAVVTDALDDLNDCSIDTNGPSNHLPRQQRQSVHMTRKYERESLSPFNSIDQSLTVEI